uniref:YqaJ viral recombinase family protein n=1 Tax=Borrelia persica TaxID=44448 RepID=UPI00056F492A
VEVLHRNKYANGIDKYNYFKEISGAKNLVGATIDGWFINKEGEAELLELKSSDSYQLKEAALEYNRTGNFIESKYFFKYYVQVQIQLACTGLSKGNLFLTVGNEVINCEIKRDNDFVIEVI